MARSRLRRVSGARKALLRSLVTALFQHGSIVTTEAKAKELRHVADKMISLAKRGDLHARRQAEAFVMDKDVTKKLFDEIARGNIPNATVVTPPWQNSKLARATTLPRF